MSEVRIVEDEAAPYYRTAKQGVSLVSECYNPTCEAYRQYIIVNLFFFSGDLKALFNSSICPACKISCAMNVSEFLFYLCHTSLSCNTTNNIVYKLSESISDITRLQVRLSTLQSLTLTVKEIETLTKIWVCGIDQKKEVTVPSSNGKVNLLSFAKVFEREFDIEIEKQSYFHDGRKVYSIDLSDITEKYYLSLVKNVKNMMIVTIMRNRETFSVPIEKSPQNTVYDALLRFAKYYKFDSIFKSDFEITDLQGSKLEFGVTLRSKELDFLQLREITSQDSIKLSFEYNNLQFTDCNYNKYTTILGIKHFLSLFIGKNHKHLNISTSFMSLSYGTLLSNKINSDTSIIITTEAKGGASQAICFSNKGDLIELIPESQDAPDWRSVSDGFVWKAKCENSLCRANNEYVFSQCGFGVFNLLVTKTNVKCPACFNGVDPISCGFFNCTYSFKGVDESRTKQKGGPFHVSNQSLYIFNEGRSEWHQLWIEVSEN